MLVHRRERLALDFAAVFGLDGHAAAMVRISERRGRFGNFICINRIDKVLIFLRFFVHIVLFQFISYYFNKSHSKSIA